MPGPIAQNPFVGLPVATVTAKRERVLTDAELADVWAAIETMGYPWGPFFCIAILTLRRREEVAAMRWSEIAPDLSVWTMSCARMKMPNRTASTCRDPRRPCCVPCPKPGARTVRAAKVRSPTSSSAQRARLRFPVLEGEGPSRRGNRRGACRGRVPRLPRNPHHSSLGACAPAAHRRLDARAAGLRHDRHR
jgi:hypothetical protein